MDERRALMGAIIENPDEDTPRLVFADWLQEHGDAHDRARAEFIRLQVEAARLPKGDKKRTKLEGSAKKLANEHHGAWLAPLAAFVHQISDDANWTDDRSHYDGLFERGLLKELIVEAAKFLQAKYQQVFPDALAAVGLETLSFYTPARRVGELPGSPALRWVSRMECPAVGDAAFEAFGTSPHLAHITAFEFGEAKISDAGLKAFARTAGTARLRKFAVTTASPRESTKARFTAAGVLALLSSPRLPALTALGVGAGAAERFGAAEFLADPRLSKLTELTFGVRGPLADVIACPHLVNLRSLRLDVTAVTEADTDALLASPTFAKLTELLLDSFGPLPPGTKKKLQSRFGNNLWLRDRAS
ncbi:TIGR02996 domain-containing protein [Gemmata sp.]|uniref:TIGR02996 domain-containing protein n=1 Tax=Gemmata sp. TaxID=1914242 RepID=UPI003F6FCB00